MIDQLNSLILTTPRLVIRPIEDADVKLVYSIHKDEQVNRYLPYDTWRSWDDAKYWYAKVLQRRRDKEAEQFVIVESGDLSSSAASEKKAQTEQALIGTCIVFNHNADDQSCEIGYVLKRDYWQQGYMFEAMSQLRNSLMARSDITSIRAVVDVENLPSLALLKKLDFEISATLNADNQQSHYLRFKAEI